MASIGLRRTPCGRLWCFRRAGLWALDPQRMAGAAAELDRGDAALAVTVRLVSPGDVMPLSRCTDIAPESIATRLALGKRCYVAQLNGEIAAHGWLSLSHEDIPELEAVFHPARGEAYVWDCFVAPPYRGRGLMGAVLSRMAADLRSEGGHRLWAIILAGNVASERAFGRARYSRVADLAYLRVLFWRHLWVVAKERLAACMIMAA